MPRFSNHRVVAVIAVLVLLTAACQKRPESTSAGPTTTAPTTTIDTPPETGGWIGGEPPWVGDDPVRSGETEGAGASLAADYAGDTGDVAAPTPSPEIVGGGNGPLTGGSVDDNEDLGAYLDYRERIIGLGIAFRELDPSGRVVIAVTGDNGLPVSGAEVVIQGDPTTTTLLTTADGTVLFHPVALAAGPGPYLVTVEGETVSAGPGDTVSLTLPRPGGVEGPVALDIMFLLDVTGSMDDEIAQLKATVSNVAARIGELPGSPDVRFGMTVYRDEQDSFLTRTFDLTDDIAAFDRALGEVVAAGGGDYPEALDEALTEVLSAPSWRDPATTVQLVFLIADAPPHVDRQVPVPYTDSMIDASRRGIRILPVASSGTDDQAEFVFRQLAQFTGGRFVFLTYGAGGRATGESTDISDLDYEELALDDLIVRQVAEELAALTGDPTVVPPTTATTTTAPPNQ